jgi:hypothetical protein
MNISYTRVRSVTAHYGLPVDERDDKVYVAEQGLETEGLVRDLDRLADEGWDLVRIWDANPDRAQTPPGNRRWSAGILVLAGASTRMEAMDTVRQVPSGARSQMLYAYTTPPP